MTRKWFIVLPLVVLELLLCAGILAVLWGGVRWVQARGLQISAFAGDRVSAEADEAQTLAVSGPATLKLDNAAGTVTLTGGAGHEVVISAHKTAYGADQAQAEAALAQLKVSVTQTGDTITVQVLMPAAVALIGSKRVDTVDFTIAVPAGTALDVRTDYGAVEASDVAGRTLDLHSSFGDVTLERATADSVDAGTSSGAVRLRQVQVTGTVTLDTSFGQVRFEDGAAERLEASSSSGAVTLLDLTVAEAVTAHSDFGDLNVERVAAGGGYDLSTSSGAVTLTGATGPVAAESGFGDVVVTGAENVTLDLHTNSGSVTFAGSLGAGPHSLRSDFGDILLRLPADAAATLDLGTDFGGIHSALPVTLSGDVDATHWEGTLNGGGARLTVHTSSGSIRIETL
jgi:DUF4097 and DUF4098 domain-containing protein YvlB